MPQDHSSCRRRSSGAGTLGSGTSLCVPGLQPHVHTESSLPTIHVQSQGPRHLPFPHTCHHTLASFRAAGRGTTQTPRGHYLQGLPTPLRPLTASESSRFRLRCPGPPPPRNPEQLWGPRGLSRWMDRKRTKTQFHPGVPTAAWPCLGNSVPPRRGSHKTSRKLRPPHPWS